jgi:chitosanase
VKAYCEAPGALFAGDLNPYLGRLSARDLALDIDLTLRHILHDAGGDPVMHDVQNQFFDSVYWNPAVQSAASLGFKDPLSTAVVYDSCIHGSWRKVRDLTNAKSGEPSALGERLWIQKYVETRKMWLGSSPNPLLQRTVYRMESFELMIASAFWDLKLPLRVRGVTIDIDALEERTPVVASADDNTQRTLYLTTPLLSGKDVETIQRALQKAGIQVGDDGVFGQETDTAVRTFQRSKGLKADGVVGPATRAALGL